VREDAGTVVVSVHLEKLRVGNYQGEIQVSLVGGKGDPITLPVTLKFRGAD
jgi:hypothetical protein